MKNIEFIAEIAKRKGLLPDLTAPSPSAIAPPTFDLPTVEPQARPLDVPVIQPAAAAVPPPATALPTVEPQPRPLQPMMTEADLPAIMAAQQQQEAAAPAPAAVPDIQPQVERYDPDRERLRELDAKDYSIRKDEHGNVVHRGKDRDPKWSTAEKILGAVVGWATGGLAGGIKGATDRNFREKIGDEFERGRILPRIEARQQVDARDAVTAANRAKPAIARAELQRKVAADKARFERQTQALEIQGQRVKDAKEKWKPYVDEQGRRWRQFTNDPSREMEPIIDPNTREQDVDPSSRQYEWTDPYSGQTVMISGKQLATVGGTIAAGNATREQQANTTNANNQLEATRANVTNSFNYSKELFDRAQALGKALGEVQGANAAGQGLYTQLQGAAEQLNNVDPVLDPKGHAAALKNFNDLQEKFYNAVAKTTAGAQAVQQMSSQGIQRPATITAPKITPSRVGKPVPRSKDPLGIFQ